MGLLVAKRFSGYNLRLATTEQLLKAQDEQTVKGQGLGANKGCMRIDGGPTAAVNERCLEHN